MYYFEEESDIGLMMEVVRSLAGRRQTFSKKGFAQAMYESIKEGITEADRDIFAVFHMESYMSDFEPNYEDVLDCLSYVPFVKQSEENDDKVSIDKDLLDRYENDRCISVPIENAADTMASQINNRYVEPVYTPSEEE